MDGRTDEQTGRQTDRPQTVTSVTNIRKVISAASIFLLLFSFNVQTSDSYERVGLT